MMRPHPTFERLHEVFVYEAETGLLLWRIRASQSILPGMPAGTIDRKGYRVTCLDRMFLKNHRIIWAMYHGEWPEDGMVVNHKDHNPSNNRIENLELTTAAQNNCHRSGPTSLSTSGVRGVSKVKQTGKWRAAITANKKSIYLGVFKTIEEAIAAREAAGPKYHGQHQGRLFKEATTNG